TNYSGKTLISYSLSDPTVVYASVADAFASIGLYRSENGGDSWTQVNSDDVAKYQGWYSHDVAVKPDDADYLVYVGVDAFVSPSTGGQSLTQTGFWYLWDFGQVPVGGPEGPADYVHADIHAAYYSPFDADAVFVVTDGGIFYSPDNGLSWEGRNGSYQTQQFYANFGNSYQDTLFGIGGLQDNATAIYVGDDAWVRVIGGDGMSAAINPDNDSILFGASQNLNVRRSLDRGESFQGIIPQDIFNEARVFNGPLELHPNVPTILYAGAQRLWKSLNNGNSWTPTTNTAVDGSNPILKIAVSPANPDVIYLSMAPLSNPPAKVLLSKDGGENWTWLSDLPDRIAMDIAFDPTDENVAYIVYSGFGTPHLYKTADGGNTWTSIDNGLPDIPTNSLFVDPLFPANLYVANDLSVHASADGGENWSLFATGLPDATLGMDLSYVPQNRKLRLATHGSGVWQVGLLDEFAGTNPPVSITLDPKIYPNPASEVINLELQLPIAGELSWQLLDPLGRQARAAAKTTTHGYYQQQIDITSLPSGIYYLKIQFEETILVRQITVV
ncbi:MAG: T9SS type A sorting domain-containing protein, partial [Phaeodactylibacter sp.]|nr:T9SS type A sorting domain-containing protein [Phaeodactylibacter sp.]